MEIAGEIREIISCVIDFQVDKTEKTRVGLIEAPKKEEET